jgi:hypothetical protein
MATYLCPRCGGTQIYYAKRQQVVGSGYAQEVRWVNTPLCKACGEMVQVFLSEEDKGLFEQWYNKQSKKAKVLFVFGSTLGAIGFLWFILWFVEVNFLN